MAELFRTPLLFESFLRPTPWGGRRLAALGKTLDEAGCGESWEISDHATHRSRLAAGPGALIGTDIRALMASHGRDIVGKPGPDAFPWLVKFLDALDWLSVQVHPDDRAARVLCPDERGKTEAWFVLEADPGARIWAGLHTGVDERTLRTAIERGKITECLHSFVPHPGDCLFLPAGTVHAVGGGVLLAEVQQTSDATFRLFDWDRTDAQGMPRRLHIEQGLAAIDWLRGPVEPMAVAAYARLACGHQPEVLPDVTQDIVRCPYFELSYAQGRAVRAGEPGTLTVLVLLSGKGHFATGEACRAGQAWVLPATLGAADLRSERGLATLIIRLPRATV